MAGIASLGFDIDCAGLKLKELDLENNNTIRESGRNTPAESLQAKIHEVEKQCWTSTLRF